MKRRPTTRILRPLFVLLLLGAASLPVYSQGPQGLLKQEKAHLRLAADRTAYEPGSRARVAGLVQIDAGWHMNSHKPTFDYLIPTELTLHPPQGGKVFAVDYPAGEMKTFAFADVPISVYQGTVRLVAEVELPEGAAGKVPLTASLRYQACNDRSCLPPVTTEAHLDLLVGPGGEPANQGIFAASAPTTPITAPSAATGPAPSGSGGPGLLVMLLLGVVGGVILNVMPCVLPVLSLKIFGLMKSAGQGRTQVVVGSLATTAGILVSFWTLALAAVVARAAGAAVGWGTQFQHPGFVTFLAIVVVLFCLNLWGLFEIPLPQRLAQMAGSGPREGLPGHFASGLFATLMATPCSAPFLGTAVGFALSQTSGTIFAVFTAVGLGMSLPYLALAAAPGAARLFPKPGVWMDHVRKVMGFLLAGAAVWLFYVLANQVSPERLAAIELGLLGLALFVWLRYRAFEGPRLRRAAAVGMLAVAVLTLGVAFRSDGQAAGRSTASKSDDLIRWQPFDQGRAEDLAAQGRIVFVDVTADWCFTCKVNENLVLETPEVAGSFKSHAVVPMRADWTNRDDTIGTFLAEHGRSSIPFYMIYRPDGETFLFSELLTKKSLLDALDDAAAATTAQLGG